MGRHPTLQLIHDALAHVYDLPFRADHPLGARLGAPDPIGPAELQRRLLAAIEQLRPQPAVAATSPRWRQYQYLRGRYLDGLCLAAIHAELGIGDRQARREHLAALQALAVVLGVHPDGEEGATLPPDPSSASRGGMAAAGVSGHPGASPLDAELARIGLASSAEPMALRSVLADAVALVQPLSRRQGVQVEMTPAGDGTVATVRTLLKQLAINLLDFLISTHPATTLRIAIAERGGMIEARFHIAVAAGSGQAEPTRAGSSRSMREAARAAAHRLASQLGGQLLIADHRPPGDVAWLSLPATEPTTVLLVDDNPDLALLFRRYLQGENFRVIHARDGEAILDLAQQTAADVIVLDLLMPLQDGWELFQQLRSHPATGRLPIIVCSILPERELALALGVDGFLTKPVTRRSVTEALRPFRRAE